MLTSGVFARLCHARNRLRDTDDCAPSIKQIAREAAVSPFHFIRQFRALFGATPHQFRIQARVDQAKHLLAVSRYSVTDVCMEVGFTSLGSFSTLFTRRVGLAPSAYRKEVRSMMPAPGVLPREMTPGCLTLMGAAFATLEKHPLVCLSDSDSTSAGPAGPGAREEGHEDQADQHHGRQPGQGVEVLYRGVGLREEA